MPKASWIQNSFNAGELSPRLKGRSDLDKYKNGCETLENFIPQVYGPVTKRPGTRFVKEVKFSGKKTRLIPFQYSINQAYMLEFGEYYIRFYRDGGNLLYTSPETNFHEWMYDLTVGDIYYFGYDTVLKIYTIYWDSSGASTAVAITGTDSLGRMYKEIGGYRYTKGTVIQSTSGNENRFEINKTFAGTEAQAEGDPGPVDGTIYEIETPYSEADLPHIHFTQSADAMFIAHPDYPPYELLRYNDLSWVLQEIEFVWPVFGDENTNKDIELTASAASGIITLTSSEPFFSPDDVGSYIKISEAVSNYRLWVPEDNTSTVTDVTRIYYQDNLYLVTTGAASPGTGSSPPLHTEGEQSDDRSTYLYWNTGAGYVEITNYTSSGEVTAVVQSPKGVTTYLPPSALTGTSRWAKGAWSETNGYPRAVSFYEDRLWFAGSYANPQTLWASVSGDYKNHFYGTDDDDALNYTINAQQVNPILWLSPGKVLAIGTSGGEFVASASSLNEAITPSNVKITPQTTYGSAEVSPYKIGGSVIFLQRAAKKIRELTYTFESDSFVAPNLLILSEHLGENGFVGMTYQQEPDQIIWVIDSEGQLFGMTYERAEDVVGWHRHDVGGIVESVATIPHWDEDQDSLWMIVQRTIDGSVVRYIEYIEKALVDDYAFFVDCGLTYDGVAATTISNLDHLEGEEVAILADGAVHPNVTVTSGEITLQVSASVVNIGLPYTATVKTMPIEAGAADGTAQGKTSRINNIVFRLRNTGPGFWYGPCSDCMDVLHLRTPSMVMSGPVPLYNGDTTFLPWPGEYEQGAQVMVEHRLPLPCSMVSLMPQLTTYDR